MASVSEPPPRRELQRASQGRPQPSQGRPQPTLSNGYSRCLRKRTQSVLFLGKQNSNRAETSRQRKPSKRQFRNRAEKTTKKQEPKKGKGNKGRGHEPQQRKRGTKGREGATRQQHQRRQQTREQEGRRPNAQKKPATSGTTREETGTAAQDEQGQPWHPTPERESKKKPVFNRSSFIVQADREVG